MVSLRFVFIAIFALSVDASSMVSKASHHTDVVKSMSHSKFVGSECGFVFSSLPLAKRFGLESAKQGLCRTFIGQDLDHFPNLRVKLHSPALRQQANEVLESDDAVSTEEAESTGPNRKERRRENRRLRNNQRHRLIVETKEGNFSIPSKEALSQHFLTDEGIIGRMVEAVMDDSPKGCRVVELGPGLGSLTAPLLERYPQMTAVELDKQAVAELQRRLPALDLRAQSLLDFDYAAHARERGGRLTIVGNLPFGITSATLFKLLDNSMHIRRAVLLVQKEVVDRLTATMDLRKYGTLSVEHAVLCNEKVQPLFVVPSLAFDPPPRNTKCSVVAIEFLPEMPLPPREHRILRQALQAAFEDKPNPLKLTLYKSRALRETVPLVRELCQEDYNWLRKKPSELSPGKWVHIARTMAAYTGGGGAEPKDPQEEA